MSAFNAIRRAIYAEHNRLRRVFVGDGAAPISEANEAAITRHVVHLPESLIAALIRIEVTWEVEIEVVGAMHPFYPLPMQSEGPRMIFGLYPMYAVEKLPAPGWRLVSWQNRPLPLPVPHVQI